MPEVIIAGPAGRLEGRYHPAGKTGAKLALILHPHPQAGGTMNNRACYEMYQLFVQREFSVLRFNFRGVGRSQGEHDQGVGELSDAAAALDWMQAINPNAGECWVAGFSFGAWIGMQLLMRRPEIAGFISAAPPANIYDFSFLAPCPSSGLFVHGGADQVIPLADVERMVSRLRTQKGKTAKLVSIPEANHFFDQNMEEYVDIVETYLDRRLSGEEE